MRPNEWEPHGRGYKELHVADKTDEKILKNLEKYRLLKHEHLVQPQYRQFRRMIVREALKRGLIDEDPGSPP